MAERLTSEQIERYSRQIMVPDLGGKAQMRLCQSRVLVIGAGGLGSPAALYLAAAGIGTLGIVDADKVELSNLQRQILHATADIGRPKVESAKTTLTALNPDVEVIAHPVRFDESNAEQIATGFDFIVDGSDNFDTKFLINDLAVNLGIAFSHAGIVRLQGQVMTVVPRKSAYYRCCSMSHRRQKSILNCRSVRHPRRCGRHHRHYSGHRGGEIFGRLRGWSAHRPSLGLRRQEHALPRGRSQTRSAMRRLRRRRHNRDHTILVPSRKSSP